MDNPKEAKVRPNVAAYLRRVEVWWRMDQHQRTAAPFTILKCDPETPSVELNSGQVTAVTDEVLEKFSWMRKYVTKSPK